MSNRIKVGSADIALPWDDPKFRKKLREYASGHASDPFALDRLIKDLELGVVDLKEFVSDEDRD